MKMLSKLGIWACVFLAVMGQNGFAQQNESGEHTVFDAIKARMISAAKDNERLVIEYKSLKSRLVSLQMEIARLKKDIEGLQPPEKNQPTAYHDPDRTFSVDEIEDDVLIREAQEIYTTGQSMGIDGAQRLKELLLYDLSFQKQELQLDWQAKQRLYQEEEARRQQELDIIQKDIEEGLAKEEGLARKMAELEREEASSAREMDLLMKTRD